MAITVWLNTDHQNDLVEFATATGAEVNPTGVLRLYRARPDAVDVQLASFAAGVWKYYTQEDPGDPAPEEPEARADTSDDNPSTTGGAQ